MQRMCRCLPLISSSIVCFSRDAAAFVISSRSVIPERFKASKRNSSATPTAAIQRPCLSGDFYFKRAQVSFLAAASDNSGDGGLILSSEAGELLANAFSSLDEKDKYDAVLTGLCAKVLDTGGAKMQAGSGSEETDDGGETADVMPTTVEDVAVEATSPLGVTEKPLRLLQEMNARRVEASPRSISAVIDTVATTENVRTMNLALSLSIRNGAVANFGYQQPNLNSLPTNPTKRRNALEKLPPVPTDDRVKEISAAVTFLGAAGGWAFIKFLGPIFLGDDAGALYLLADLAFWAVVLVSVLDNFYDPVRLASKTVDAVPNDLMPKKEDLALGFGKGQWTGGVIAGLTRLFSSDTERECQCEAAAFFAAYSLGLPCFAFRPNALEAAFMVFESTKNDSSSNQRNNDKEDVTSLFRTLPLDPLNSEQGILKVLVWLMAPVAMEQMKHPQMIASDPREGQGLLNRLREKAVAVMGESNAEALFDVMRFGNEEDGEDEEEEEDAAEGVKRKVRKGDDDILRWAYSESNALLRDNAEVLKELTEGLAGGAFTVGDCVAVVENW